LDNTVVGLLIETAPDLKGIRVFLQGFLIFPGLQNRERITVFIGGREIGLGCRLIPCMN